MNSRKYLALMAFILIAMSVIVFRQDSAAEDTTCPNLSPIPIGVFADMSMLTQGQQLALISLQGLVNRNGPIIYLRNLYSGSIQNRDWLEQVIYSAQGEAGSTPYQASGCLGRFQAAYQNKKIYTDYQKMIADYKSAAGLKGAVVWDPSRPFTLNIATNLAGVNNLLMITPDMKDMATALGLSTQYEDELFHKFNTGNVATDLLNAETWVFNTFKNQYNQNYLANMYFRVNGNKVNTPSTNDGDRDFVIQNKIHTFWIPGWGTRSQNYAKTKSTENDPEYSPELVQFIENILASYPINIPVFGMWAGPDANNVIRGLNEVDANWMVGQYAKYYLPDDNATNYSFHSRVPYDKGAIRQTLPRANAQALTYDPSKKYVSLVMHDSGDSPSFFQFFFYWSHWADTDRGAVPITYSLTTKMLEMMPAAVQYFYQTATKNDFFITSVSGLGYSYPFMGYGNAMAKSKSGIYFVDSYSVNSPYEPLINPDYVNSPTPNASAALDHILNDYYQKTDVAMQKMDMDVMEIYSDNQQWDADPAPRMYRDWDSLINTFMIPNLKGLTSIVTDLGILPHMQAWQSSRLLAENVSIFHTLTDYNPGNKYGLLPSANPAQNDQGAADWLGSQIVSHSNGTHFIQAMAFSWMYNPHRLKLVMQELSSQGYVVGPKKVDFTLRHS